MKRAIRIALCCLVVLGVVASVLALRSRGSDMPPEVVNEALSKPQDRYDQIIETIRQEGLTKERALEAFSLLYGPIPDVTVPSDLSSTHPPMYSGEVITLVRRVWDELTEPQRDAVRKYLHMGESPQLVMTGDGKVLEPSIARGPDGSTSRGLTSPGSSDGVIRQAMPAAPGVPQAAGDLYDLGTWVSIIRQVNYELAPRLAVPPIEMFGVSVYPTKVVDKKGKDYVPLADTSSYEEGGAPITFDGRPGCKINIYPYNWLSDGPVTRLSAATHEVFHCYAQRAAGTLARQEAMGEWLNEGAPVWAQEVLHPTGSALQSSVKFWAQWALTPETMLFVRSYDAVGFYGHVGDIAGSQDALWPRLIPAVIAGTTSDVTAYQIIVGPEEGRALDTWGSSYRRAAGRPPWDMLGPGAVPSPASRVPPNQVPVVTREAPQVIGPVLPFAASLSEVSFGNEIGKITLQTGHGRLATEDFAIDEQMTSSNNVWFCLDGNGCQCPEKTHRPDGVNLRDARNPFQLGLSGGTTTASAVATSLSLDDFCVPDDEDKDKSKDQPMPKPDPNANKNKGKGKGKGKGGRGGGKGPSSPLDGPTDDNDDGDGDGPSGPMCPGGCGGSNGDPHLVTFDGVRYDLQAVGEFTVVRSQGQQAQPAQPAQPARFEVQARQRAMEGSKTVSANEQIGVRVGDTRVTFSLGRSGMEIRENGVVRRADEVRVSGASIRSAHNSTGAGYTVALEDGTKVHLLPIGVFGINLQIELGKDRAGKVEGLLGNGNGDRKDDLVTAEGKSLGDKPFADDIYGGLADRWRVSSRSTILDYGEGQSTETFTDRAFPDRSVPPPSGARRAQAEQICRESGVTEAASLDACILDVASTGQSLFADSAALDQEVQQAATEQRRRSHGEVFEGDIRSRGDQLTMQFEGEKDELVYIGGKEGECEDHGIDVFVKSPDGRDVRVDAACRIGRVQLPQSGTYTVVVNGAHLGQGHFRVPLVPLRPDTRRAVEVGGELSGRIGHVGEADTFVLRSNGHEVVQISGDGCVDAGMGVTIKGPDGQTLQTSIGCLLRDVRLERAGDYTIELNVLHDHTGEYRLPLRHA